MEQDTEKATFSESRLPTLSTRVGRQRSGLPRPSLLPSAIRPENKLTVTEKADTEGSEKVVATSMSSTCAIANISDEHSEWKRWVGQKVCIGTVKKGILRYFGETHFAEGLWCGVELSEPVGKNDGSVKGVRYFNCQENHGIFAPLSKIERYLSSEYLQETLDNTQQLPNKIQCPSVKSKLPPPKIILKTTVPKDTKNCVGESEEIPLHDTTYSKLPKGALNETVITYKKRTNDISFTVPSKISRFSSVHPPVLESKDYEVKSNFLISTTTNNTCFSNKSTLARKRSLPLNVSYSIRTHGQYLDRPTDDSKNTKDILNRTVSLSEPAYCDDDIDFKEASNLNTTFSINNSNQELPKDVLNSTFSLLPSSDDVLSQMIENKEDEILEHNRTFTVDELQQMIRGCDNATTNLLHKHKGSDEDLVSYDCDESLGILTPSQMKDFTVCTDNQPPLLDAANLIRIPKMESCDDINDIPEDEIIQNISPGFSPIEDIREVQSIFPGSGTHYDTTGTESSTSSPENRLQEILHDSFDCPQVKIDNLAENSFSSGSLKTSTPFSSSLNTTVKNAFFDEQSLKDKENGYLCRKIFNGNDCSPLKCNICPMDPLYSTHDSDEKVKVTKILHGSYDNLHKITDEIKLDNELLPHFDLIDISMSTARNETAQLLTGNEDFLDDKTVNSSDGDKQEIPFAKSLHKIELMSTDREKNIKCEPCDSFVHLDATYEIQPMNETHPIIVQDFKDKPMEITEELHPETVHPKKEGPSFASMVGSTDTGYHGDGDFDNQSEPGITVLESPCDENMKQSMHDSCIGTDYSHSERNQKSDIMTDSDFYTDSGGVGMTESEIELDGECKDLNRTFDKPFSALGDNNHLDYVNDLDKPSENALQETLRNDENTTITNSLNKDLTLTENVLSSTFGINKVSPEESLTQTKMDDTFNLEEQSSTSVTQHFTDLKEKIETVTEKKNLTFAGSKINERDNASRNSLSKHKVQLEKKNVPLNNLEGTKTSRQTADNRNNLLRISNKNVASKTKAVIETNKLTKKVFEKNEVKPTPRKNNKWDAVTSKIAASLADQKTKPKTRREIKSKIDTNLTASRYSVAKKSPRLNSGSTSILTENDNSSNSFETGNKVTKNTLNSQRSLEEKENAQHFTFAEPEVFVQNNVNCGLGHGDGNSKPGGLSHRLESSKPAKLLTSKPASLTVAQRRSFASKEVSKRAAPVSAPSTWRPSGPPPATPTTRNACPPKSLPASHVNRTPKDHTLNKGGRFVTTHRLLSTPPESKKSTWVSKAELAQEIQHLGALCEARTKELNMLKMQLKHAALGFEAFGVLSQYLTEELDAFAHPKFVVELHRTQQELNKAGSQLQFYQKQLEELKETHAHEIIVLTAKLGQAHLEEIDALKKRHIEELAEIEALHKEQVACLKKGLVSALEEVEKKHSYVLETLNNDYQKHKEEIQRMHAQQLEETQHTHEEAQESLHNQLKELQKQYDILQQQAKKAEDAFLRDKNSKIQWMSAKKIDLEKEVESLKTVLEMKSTEIHALRRENLEMKKELEELPKAREAIRKLEAKKEDLQAMMKEKVYAQEQIFSEHEQLAKDLEKESKVKERLSMENEALQWRLQQSMESTYILHSLAASQDLREEFAREGYVKIPHRSRCSLPVLVGETDMERSDLFSSDIMSSSVPSFSPSYKKSDRSSSLTTSWHPSLSSQIDPAFFSPISEHRRPRSASERPSLASTKGYLKRTSQNFRHTPKKEKQSFRKDYLVQNLIQQGSHEVDTPLEHIEDAQENNLVGSAADVKQTNSCQTAIGKDTFGSIIEEVLEFLVDSCEKATTPNVTRNSQKQTQETSDMCHTQQLSTDIPPVLNCKNTDLSSTVETARVIKNRDEFPKFSPLSLHRGTGQREIWAGTDIDTTSHSEIIRQGQETLSPEVSEAEQDMIALVREADAQESSLVSASLQSSLNSSDDSSWSIPLQHVTHHSISPGEDSSSSYSSKSQEGGSLAEHSDKSSCGDMMGPSDDRHYISSPRSLAGEAMIQEESTTSHSHTHRFFLDVPCDLLAEGPLDEMHCHDISSSPEEVKEKIVNHICSETPSMETSSQGMLLTDSTNMDVSWGEDEMPSEADV